MTARQLLSFSLLAFIWGTTWLGIKLVVREMPPLTAAGARFALAALLLAVFARWRGRGLGWGRLSRTEQALLLALSLLMFAIPYAFVFYGEQFISSALTSILFASAPVFTLLYDSLRLRQNLFGGTRLLGLVLATIGLLVILGPRLEGPPAELFGALAVVASAAVSSLGLVLAKHYGHGIDPTVGTTWQMGLGAAWLLLVGLPLERPGVEGYSAVALLALLYLALFGSCLTFVLFYALLKEMAPVQLSSLTFLTPVVAVFVGWLVLDEVLSLTSFAGAAVVLAGVALIHRPMPEPVPEVIATGD